MTANESAEIPMKIRNLKNVKRIIDSYNIGFSIKRKCKTCEKMLNEKNIANIRSPEIKQ